MELQYICINYRYVVEFLKRFGRVSTRLLTWVTSEAINGNWEMMGMPKWDVHF